MPARQSGDETLPALLSMTHISKTSAVDDLAEQNAVHKHAVELAAAHAEHKRVRDSALRAYKNHELREAQERLRRQQLQELERLKLEAEKAELAAKVLELQRKKVPVPVPRSPTPPPAADPSKPAADASSRRTQNEQVLHRLEHVAPRSPARQKTPPLPSAPSPPSGAPSQNASAAPTSIQHQSQPSKALIFPQKQTAITRASTSTDASQKPLATITVPQGTARDADPPHGLPGSQKYLEIHKRLKQLRAFLADRAKQDAALKKRMGEMRREIRKSVGQLTEGRGANKTPVGN